MSELKLSPGIYHDVPWSQYREIPYPSPSMLKHGLRSMKRLKRAADGELAPSETTVAVGQAVHCMISNEADRLAVMPAFEQDAENKTKTGQPSKSKSTDYYKEQKAKWEAGNQSKNENVSCPNGDS